MKKTFAVIVFGCLLLGTALAEHEADHRYNIRGYILDDMQKGMADLVVQAYAEENLLGSGKTDADGYYSLQLHLHNSDFGRVIRLRAGSYEAELRVTFDAKDRSADRLHEANFIGGEFVEGALDRFRMPSWAYLLGGLSILVIIVIVLESHRKNKLKRAKNSSSIKRTPGKRSRDKGRRKKH